MSTNTADARLVSSDGAEDDKSVLPSRAARSSFCKRTLGGC